MTPATPKLWTVGHSTRSGDEFVELLVGQGITLVADVRRFPASRRHPQFNAEELAAALSARDIKYRHFPELGGRRSTRAADSHNTAWRVEAFNAYADHLETTEGQAALEELAAIATAVPTAIVCAEALPWRCHRRIIADAMMARGWTVFDILSSGDVREHALPPFAKTSAGHVTYPGGTLF